MAHYKQMTASGPVSMTGSPAKLVGFEVVVTMSAATIELRNENASGQIVMIIPASSALGTSRNLANAIACPKGIWAVFNGTGTVNILWD